MYFCRSHAARRYAAHAPANHHNYDQTTLRFIDKIPRAAGCSIGVPLDAITLSMDCSRIIHLRKWIEIMAQVEVLARTREYPVKHVLVKQAVAWIP